MAWVPLLQPPSQGVRPFHPQRLGVRPFHPQRLWVRPFHPQRLGVRPLDGIKLENTLQCQSIPDTPTSNALALNKPSLMSFRDGHETKKSEKQLPRLPKNDKKPSSNVLNTMLMKSRFLQYILCENLDLEVPSVES